MRISDWSSDVCSSDLEKLIRQLIDDLDGKPIDDGFGDRIEFSYQGTDYVIDLRATNAEKFDAAVKPFVEAAAKVSGKRGKKAKAASPQATSGSGRSKETLQAIRDWAGKNRSEAHTTELQSL